MSKRQYKPRSYICQSQLEDGQTCNRGFRNRSGLTQHINAKHRFFAAISAHPDQHNVINDHGDVDLMASGPDVPEGTDIQSAAVGRQRTMEKHPLLDGKVHSSCTYVPHVNGYYQEHHVII